MHDYITGIAIVGLCTAVAIIIGRRWYEANKRWWQNQDSN